MYDSKMFANISKFDRKYQIIDDEEDVIRFNIAQSICCNRCIYTEFDDFSSIMGDNIEKMKNSLKRGKN